MSQTQQYDYPAHRLRSQAGSSEVQRLRAEIERLQALLPLIDALNGEIARLKTERIILFNWLNTHHPHVAIAWARDQDRSALESKP